MDLHPLPPGIVAGGVNCGIRSDRLDLGLLCADRPRRAAAVFTNNRLIGAHVEVNREHLERTGGWVRAVLVNSGNANCSTGREGVEDNRRISAALAGALRCDPTEVLFLSTGVIGARLPTERILNGLPSLLESASPDGAPDFARAIMTTDTRPKTASADAGEAGVVGFAKGSGMIHPDMATMLGFLVTDAALPEDPRSLLRTTCDSSFNRVSVDGDTSPNDTVILLGGEVDAGDRLAPALREVSVRLARDIASDGEGASRLVTIRVEGAVDTETATHIGRTVATSPLVKTAITGRDPNWGRIVSAAGRAGVPFDPDSARLWIGPGLVFERGLPHPEAEAAAHEHMLKESEVLVRLDLGAGEASADIWTCDLTADYVSINADYRT